MRRLAFALLPLLLARPALAIERLAVIAVADRPQGLDPELGEVAGLVRAACQGRAGQVIDVREMRASLTGEGRWIRLDELDRAHRGAMAVYDSGEYAAAARALRALVEDLERQPAVAGIHDQWARARLNLGRVELALHREEEARAAVGPVAAVDPRYRPDPALFPPAARQLLDETREILRSKPKGTLLVDAALDAADAPARVRVNGKPVGAAPLRLDLPEGSYTVSASVGPAATPLLMPPVRVELVGPQRVELDLRLLRSMKLEAGPGFAMPGPGWSGVRAVARWLGADSIIAVALKTVDGRRALVGALHDVRRSIVVREASVPLPPGEAISSGALAAFASGLLPGEAPSPGAAH